MSTAIFPIPSRVNWLGHDFRPNLFLRLVQAWRARSAVTVAGQLSMTAAQQEAQALRVLARGWFKGDHRMAQELAAVADWHEAQSTH